MRLVVVLLLIVPALQATTPQESLATATRDVASLPKDVAYTTRYLRLPPNTKEHADWKRVVDFAINSFSRSSKLYTTTLVAPDLLRIQLDLYRIDPAVWEKLADVDPYWHEDVSTETVTTPDTKATSKLEYWPGGVNPVDGKYYSPGNYQMERKAKPAEKKVVKKRALTDGQQQLALLTRSQAPILEADWWLVQVFQQVDRKGTGYYDFLGVKDRAEFQKRVGLDQKLAQELEKEIRAAVKKSGVALNNRHIVRFQTITGAYWGTLDSEKSVKESNALVNLEGFKHQAEEVYGNIPNGLFAYFLGSDQGVRQDSAPDKIASDGKAPGNDKRVHVGVSCVRCHVEGIRPIKDWARRVYRPPIPLVSEDRKTTERLARLYLEELQRFVTRDQNDYSERLEALTGLKSAEFAAVFARLHESYAEAEYGLADLSARSGISAAKLRETIAFVARNKPPFDPILSGLLHETEEKIRIEHVEEVYQLLLKTAKVLK